MLNHLAIIMDWNRRWAKQRFLPTIAWHKAWADNIEKVMELAKNKWINYITLWWLSTENLINRDSKEIEWIIKIIDNSLKYLPNMMKNWVKFETIWDIKRLPIKSQEVLETMKKQTLNNTWIVMTIAFIYWWQDEIIRWIKKYIQDWWDLESLTTKEFRKYLDTNFLPEPEVIVRTGWDIRHSWFLLYDSAYSEYYFTNKKWPEFDEEELNKVIDSFNNSKRNFGK